MSSHLNNTPLMMAGALVLGLATTVGLFIYEKVSQNKRRHAMAMDLERLNRQVSLMRSELETLRELQRSRRGNETAKSRKRGHTSAQSVSSESYTTAGDVDSSDLEFYDLTSEDESETPLEKTFKDIDERFFNVSELEKILGQLLEMQEGDPKNADILWRLGKAYHALAAKEPEKKLYYLEKSIEVCRMALEVNPVSSDSHKWLAISLGKRANDQPFSEKIKDANNFRKHIKLAQSLNPKDAATHHVLGRYTFECAGMNWFEKRAAAMVLDEPPEASYEGALKYFEEAERLINRDWKENRLYVAKCHIALGNYNTAYEWLGKASSSVDILSDPEVDKELVELLEKYKQ